MLKFAQKNISKKFTAHFFSRDIFRVHRTSACPMKYPFREKRGLVRRKLSLPCQNRNPHPEKRER